MPASYLLIALMLLSTPAFAATWSCHGTKPGHPTPAERAAFVQEVSALAVEAEKKHGVPAGGIAALAIIESGYGWTRVALKANNLFAWKAGPSDAHRAYVPICQRAMARKTSYLMFGSRPEAFELVAAKLATLDGYREYTHNYREARRRGEPAEPAVNAWVAGIATRYSRKPDEFTEKMLRVMKDPEQRGPAARDYGLYDLSHKASVRH